MHVLHAGECELCVTHYVDISDRNMYFFFFVNMFQAATRIQIIMRMDV